MPLTPTQDPTAAMNTATKLQNPVIEDNAYISQSQVCETVDTIVPLSMRYEMLKAIENVGRRVNGVDLYVAEKLNYMPEKCSIQQKQEGIKCLCDAFSAEQVDALAVIIHNIESKQHATIIGDQTGVGKGRIAAGILRYGAMRGLNTIFLTEKPNLFSDMFRDIINIGSDDNVPLYFIQDSKKEKKVSVTTAEIINAIKEDIKAGDFDEEGYDAEDVFKGDDNSKARLKHLIEVYEEKYFDEEVVRVDDYKLNKYYAQDIKGKNLMRPFIVNGSSNKTNIKNEKGDIIYTGVTKSETNNIIKDAKLPAGYKIIMATYSQFNAKAETAKKTFLRAMAQNAIIVMDESHNSSGSSNTGVYLMDVLKDSLGVCFLSATFAKRPDNMPIYASKTVISDVNMTPQELVSAIVAGGTALQEILSSQIVAEGEMLRRERSYEGVQVDYIILDESQEKNGNPNLNKAIEDSAISDATMEIVRDIIKFQLDFVQPEIEEMDNILKAEGAEVEQRKGTQEAGISNPPVFSGIFNIVSQFLMSVKAESVADIAISDLKAGRKPIIAFANTMESFLNSMTNDDGTLVEVGDRIPTDFSHIFERRLKSVLKYTVTSYKEIETLDGGIEFMPVKEYLALNPSDMSITFQNEYNRIEQKIRETTIGIASSPIDVMIKKIEAAGFTVGEVTGRSRSLEFIDDRTAMIKLRNKMNANDAFRMFNDNEIDCLLINQSGATGASAHAAPTAKVKKVNYDANGKVIIPTSLYPKDEIKQRVMLILQPELDVNKEVQKRGRIHRTGQKILPIYRYVTSAIPAEGRLMMMLQKKLKSLDANTTSNQKESRSILDVPDFLNKYGDEIVVEYLKENEDINRMIDDPLGLIGTDGDESKEKNVQDKAHKVSGRIAILPVKQQADFYNEMASRYLALVEYYKASGEYDLEVESINLEAETVDRQIKIAGKRGGSVFSRDTILERCKVNNLRKPFKKVELTELLKQALTDEKGKNVTAEEQREEHTTQLVNYFAAKKQADLDDNNSYYDGLIKNIVNERDYKKIPESATALQISYVKERTTALNDARRESADRSARISDNKRDGLKKSFNFFYTGKACAYPSVSFNETGLFFSAICLGFVINRQAKNPYAPSALKLRFAIANGLKYVNIPLSKYKLINDIELITRREISRYDEYNMLDNWDEITKESTLEKITQYIVTGNILQGYAKPEYRTGKLISYTTNTGGIKKGILLPYGFDPTNMKGRSETVSLPIVQALPIIKSMKSGRSLDTNGNLAILKVYSQYGDEDNYTISVPLNKKLGEKYFLNQKLTDFSVEGMWNKKADRQNITVEASQIEAVVNFLGERYNLNAEVGQHEFNFLGIKPEDYNDEEVFTAQSDEFLSKLQEEDTKAVQEMEEKARIAKQQEEEEKNMQELEEDETRMQEREQAIEVIKKQAAREKILRFISLLQGEALKSGSSSGSGRSSGKDELEFKTIPALVKTFMPLHQQRIVNRNIAEFQDVIKHLVDVISNAHKTYEQDGKGDDAIVSLHYFYGNMDWWITEIDKEEEQQQAFGYVKFGSEGELGYISIEEIVGNGKVELDFYFKPKTLAAVKEKEGVAEEEYKRGGKVNTWFPGTAYSTIGGVNQLSFSKVDYDVNVNLKNLEVDVNIKENDSVNQYDLNDSGATWNQHHWGYMVYPKNKEQLFAVLRALKVRFSEERVGNALKGKQYAVGGSINKEDLGLQEVKLMEELRSYKADLAEEKNAEKRTVIKELIEEVQKELDEVRGKLMKQGGSVNNKNLYVLMVQKTPTSPWEFVFEEEVTKEEAEQRKQDYIKSGKPYYKLEVEIPLPFKQGGQVERLNVWGKLKEEWEKEANAKLDKERKENQHLINARLKAYNDRAAGAGVGDFIKLSNGKYTRITNVDGEHLQAGGSPESYGYYMSKGGGQTYSGLLGGLIKISDVIPAAETKKGKVWIFKNDNVTADNSIDFDIDLRVFKLKPGAIIPSEYFNEHETFEKSFYEQGGSLKTVTISDLGTQMNYRVLREAGDNLVVVGADAYDLWLKATPMERFEYYEEIIPKSEFDEYKKQGGQLTWRDLRQHNINSIAIKTGEGRVGEKAKTKIYFDVDAIYIKGERLPDDFLSPDFTQRLYSLLDHPEFVNNPRNTEKVFKNFKHHALKFINDPKKHWISEGQKKEIIKLINSISSLDDITYSVAADRYAAGGGIKGMFKNLSAKTSELYGKGKSAINQKLHDNKKKAALDVLMEMGMLASVSQKQEEKIINPAYDLVYEKYEKGGNMQYDFNDLENEPLRKALISFWFDLQHSIGSSLSIGKDDYIIDSVNNLLIIFRIKSAGDFSETEMLKIQNFIEPYLDKTKKPLFAKHIAGNYFNGNKIIVKIRNVYEQGGSIPSNAYVYRFHEERGDLQAYVQDMNTDETVWQFNYPDYNLDEEDFGTQSTPVEDGFMKHWDDVDGLRKYLISLEIIPEDAQLLTEAQAQKRFDYYKQGGSVGITVSDIKEGARFKISSGTVFIIDKVRPDNDFGTLVESSLEGGAKGNYKDEINDVVAFLNEEGAVKSMAHGGSVNEIAHEKQFLSKDRSGRGDKSHILTESDIRKYWDLSETSDDDQALEEFLDESEDGDTWISGTEYLENVGTKMAHGGLLKKHKTLKQAFSELSESDKNEIAVAGKLNAAGQTVADKYKIPHIPFSDYVYYEQTHGKMEQGGSLSQRYALCTRDYEGATPDVKFTFDAKDDADAKDKARKWAQYQGMSFYTDQNKDRSDVVVRKAYGDMELGWTPHNEYVEDLKKGGSLDFFWVTPKEKYGQGEDVVYKDINGVFNQYGTVNKVHKQDGVTVYDVVGVNSSNATYVASELRPASWIHKDFYIIPETPGTYLIQTREGNTRQKVKSLEEAKVWIEEQYEPLMKQGGSVEFGDFGEDWVAWRLANYAYDRAYSGATIRELLNVAKTEAPNSEWLPIDILAKVKNELVPRGYVLTDENMFTGKVYWGPYSPNQSSRTSEKQVKP